MVTEGPCTDQKDQPRDDDQKPDTPDIPSGDSNAKPLEGQSHGHSDRRGTTRAGRLYEAGCVHPMWSWVHAHGDASGHSRFASARHDVARNVQPRGVGPCTFTVDANTVDTTEQCPSFDLNVRYALTKNG